MKFNPLLPASQHAYLVRAETGLIFPAYIVHRWDHYILGNLYYSPETRGYAYKPLEIKHSCEELQAIESFLAVLNGITRHFFPEGHEYTGGV